MNRRLTLVGLSCAAAIAALTLAGCGNNDSSSSSSMPVNPVGLNSGAAAAGKTPAKTDSATLAVPFSSVKLLSPVQHVTKSIEGVKMEFVKFKFMDSAGTPCFAQMPLEETKTSRTQAQWQSKFNMYKVASAVKATKKRGPQKVERLNDFPFVSPPQDENNSTQKSQGVLPSGPPPSHPNPYGR